MSPVSFTVSVANCCVDGDLILQPRFLLPRRCNRIEILSLAGEW